MRQGDGRAGYGGDSGLSRDAQELGGMLERGFDLPTSLKFAFGDTSVSETTDSSLGAEDDDLKMTTNEDPGIDN